MSAVLSLESGFSHSQRLVWLGQSLAPGLPHYNMAFNFHLECELDVARFEQAFGNLVSRCDALRAFSADGPDGCRAAIHPPAWSPGLELLDVSSAEGPAAEATAWAHEDASRVLPWGERLVRSALLRIGREHHVWYLNQHHLITDAWSCRLLLEAIGEEYAQLGRGGGSPLPPLPSFAAHAARCATRSESFEAARTHWRAVYQRAQDTAALYGREADERSTASRRVALRLDPSQVQAIRSLAARRFPSLSTDTSTFSAFAALLVAWIRRISGRETVGFEAPAANRGTALERRIPGLFIELFPIAVGVADGDSFTELGNRICEAMRDYLRFARAGASVPEHNRGCDVVLNFIPFDLGSFEGRPVRAEWLHSGHSDPRHSVRLQICDLEGSGGLTLLFDLKRSLFDAGPGRDAVAVFERLLEAFVSDPDTAIGAVPVLDVDAYERTIIDYNRTREAPRPRAPVLATILERARRWDDRVALRSGARELRYAELAPAVEGIASALASRGVAAGDLVGIRMSRSMDAMLAILGVHRAGAAYVPIDPAYPLERQRQLVSESGLRALVEDGENSPPSEIDGVRTIPIQALRELPRAIAPPMPAFESLAYVLYTSGSTGVPKGVAVSQQGLANYLEWAERSYCADAPLDFALFTSMSFDLTVTSMFLPLLCGGAVHIYPPGEGEVDAALFQVLKDNRASAIKLTPSQLRLMRRLDLAHSRIRCVIVGGERFDTELALDMSRQFGGAAIYNEYGPTEAVVGCMLHRFDPDSDLRAEVPIGRPADHTRIYLLNDCGVPVPEGVPGEIHVARVGLATQYHRRPELGAETFLADPFYPGATMYRTGDLARFESPGSMVYLGRRDSQVKISGHRLELAEVESLLQDHSQVQSCALVLRSESSPEVLAPGRCVRCGVGSDCPGIRLDNEGLCNLCGDFENCRDRVEAFFKGREALRRAIVSAGRGRRRAYDCMVLLSGGKDSTYALCQVVAMGLDVYAFTLDNGYLSEQARGNIERVVESLGIGHEFASTPSMPEIFRDSLDRYSNVCQGCFKTLYSLSLSRAHELGIPVIVTGLSRGQLFETRLNLGLFRSDRFGDADIDGVVVEARKAYHRRPDAVTRCLGSELFETDAIFEEVKLLDFYRYCSAPLDEMLEYLQTNTPWIRPSDTGRSSNCLINDVGIWVHTRERGYHNYALPYSWDVRLGQKQRDEALEELDDAIDEGRVAEILDRIGYVPKQRRREPRHDSLVAFYSGEDATDETALRSYLERRLPRWAVPHRFLQLPALPLNAHGKVDRAALAARIEEEDAAREILPPRTHAERALAALWAEVLSRGRVSAQDSFFEIGGTSLAAIELMTLLCARFDVDLPLDLPFRKPCLDAMAEDLEHAIEAQIEELSDQEVEQRLDELGTP